MNVVFWSVLPSRHCMKSHTRLMSNTALPAQAFRRLLGAYTEYSVRVLCLCVVDRKWHMQLSMCSRAFLESNNVNTGDARTHPFQPSQI